MARRQKKSDSFGIDQPGLFDPPSLQEIPEMPGTGLPIHPAISAFAAKATISGGAATERRTPDAVIDPITSPVQRKPMSFMSFGSGSSGNCSYVGNGSTGFLIDAGVSADHVEDTLLHNGVDIDSLAGIIITHDHSDHVHYAYTLLRKHRNMRLYCTPKTLNGMLRRHSLSRRIKDFHVAVYKEFPFKIGPFEITAFDVSHDGTDNAGFFIEYAGQRMAVATDLGCITDRVDHYMRQANHIVIESNYDSHMLAVGPYPEYLKARIAGGRGHLDNTITAEYLANIYTPALANVFLCHLSHDNNLPDIARKAVAEALVRAGAESVGDGSHSKEAQRAPVQLAVLPRFAASPLYTLLSTQKK